MEALERAEAQAQAQERAEAQAQAQERAEAQALAQERAEPEAQASQTLAQALGLNEAQAKNDDLMRRILASIQANGYAGRVGDIPREPRQGYG